MVFRYLLKLLGLQKKSLLPQTSDERSQDSIEWSGGSARQNVILEFTKRFGAPNRETQKVKSWRISDDADAVVQVDGPKEDAACIWLPYPIDGSGLPDAAMEYPAEAGRHSGTYPSRGLKSGEPALKVVIRQRNELADLFDYIETLSLSAEGAPKSVAPAQIESNSPSPAPNEFIDPAQMPAPRPPKPRREAIPRLVQREVWQRDGGRCVECSTRERLCFDHIVPFSKGGSNSVRNLQLLCESCNLTKGNRI